MAGLTRLLESTSRLLAANQVFVKTLQLLWGVKLNFNPAPLAFLDNPNPGAQGPFQPFDGGTHVGILSQLFFFARRFRPACRHGLFHLTH
jgi:hypothetical protein